MASGWMCSRFLATTATTMNLRFLRSTIRSCSSIAGFPPSFPILMLPSKDVASIPNSYQKVVSLRFFSPMKNEITELANRTLPEEISGSVCVGSSHGWLGYFNRRDCGFYLANMLSTSFSPQIMKLPSIEKLRHVVRVERDSSNFVKHFGFILFSHIDGKPHSFRADAIIHKFAISSSLSSSSSASNNVCFVMISYGIADVALCRIGGPSWFTLERQRGPLKDILYSKSNKLFYAITQRGAISAWDPNSRYPTQINFDFVFPDIPCSPLLDRVHKNLRRESEYLVETPEGDILNVVRGVVGVGEDGSFIKTDGTSPRPPYKTVWFEVYKLDFEKQTVQLVTHLGETILFLGFNDSFSVSACDYPGLKPNSIYFSDDYMPTLSLEFPFGGHDMGVYDLESRTVATLYQRPDIFEKIFPPPLWMSKPSDLSYECDKKLGVAKRHNLGTANLDFWWWCSSLVVLILAHRWLF